MNTYITSIFLLIITPFLGHSQMFQQSQNEAGIDHIFFQVQFNGGGAAWVDIDNDNDDDLYLVGGERGDKLYMNNGDGTFSDISSGAGLDITDNYYTTGVIYGDIDNDGYKDIYVNTHFSDTEQFARNLLFRNNGDYTFTEVWEVNNEVDRSMTMGSVLLDFDLDGDLDIYTVSYVEEIRFTFNDNNQIDGYDHDCFANQLYRNNGNFSFSNVTNQYGVNDSGCALAVTASDIDMDNDLDLLIGNDFGPFIKPNIFYQNDISNSRFVKTPDSYGTNVAMYAMGFGISDYDNDLDLDYYISNTGANIFLENNEGIFEDVASQANCENEFVFDNTKWSVSWGNFFADIDNDGDEDLFVANGYVPGPTSILNNGLLDPDRLFINNGDKSFTMIDTLAGINNTFVSRGTAYSDYDMDGDIDMITVVFNKPNFGNTPQSPLYENITEQSNNWVQFRLQGTQANRDAYGSKVYLHAGGKIQLRELSGGASFCSHSSSVIHFGLDNIEEIDSVEIVWTGGLHREMIYNIEANQQHTIVESIFNSNVNPLSSHDIKIYPNPARNNITIQSEYNINMIEVFNLLGHNVLTGKLQNGILDISHLQFGSYIVKIHSDAGISYEKILVANN